MNLPKNLLGWILFILFWGVLCLVTSILSGWSKLARKYSGKMNNIEARYRFCWNWFGKGLAGVKYGPLLTADLGSEGLGLSLLFPFRLGHPPILIPWKFIKEIEMRKIWMIQYARIVMEEAVVNIRGEKGQAIFRYYKDLNKN